MRVEGGLHDVADLTPIKPSNYEFVFKTPLEINPDVNEKTDIGGRLYTFIAWPEVATGPEAGKKARRQFNNKTKGSRYYLKRFLEMIGITIGSDGSFNSDTLLGKRFKADIIERPYIDKNTGEAKKASDLVVDSIKPL